ncbi:MAG TPA: UDP-N-acetylmuramoyl-L-alanyl-D-glutamate--2,6-diaminopimelate ligase, partial [Fodinibius sp.]|nr:UDP-N-acetylmuramoyl-L-alanyl-D-glutamate--2,6-diaminopimelate ligase [Fodinibius sp.]
LSYQALQQLGAKTALLGTVAKRIGNDILPSSLTTADPIEIADDMQQMLKAGATHLVMEVSSHALDQLRTKGISFDVAVFTNLSHDHLDYHKNFTDYARSKKKLFDSLKSDATAVINGDDKKAQSMVADCQAEVVTFSFSSTEGLSCHISHNNTNGLSLQIGHTPVESPLIGEFNAYNIAEAFLICRALGFESQAIASALKLATGAEGRMEKVASSANQPLVLVDYAHTPDALKNVLKTLTELKTDRQKLHVIFGCGGDRDKSKRPQMAAIAETYAGRITVTSDNPRSEDPGAIIDDIMAGFENQSAIKRITDRKAAITETIRHADAQTIILIAGKGHETYQEVDGKRLDFDDRQVARQALENGNLKSVES